MAAPSVSLVRRKVATGGGTRRTISAMRSSSMTPGPLGMAPTKPSASAPAATAARASSREEMQQIFTRVRTEKESITGVIGPDGGGPYQRTNGYGGQRGSPRNHTRDARRGSWMGWAPEVPMG